MDQTLDHVTAAALQLLAAERAELASRLLASLDDAEDPPLTPGEWEAAWTVECDRREAELDASPSIAIPADEAFRRVRASLDARSARPGEAA